MGIVAALAAQIRVAGHAVHRWRDVEAVVCFAKTKATQTKCNMMAPSVPHLAQSPAMTLRMRCTAARCCDATNSASSVTYEHSAQTMDVPATSAQPLRVRPDVLAQLRQTKCAHERMRPSVGRLRHSTQSTSRSSSADLSPRRSLSRIDTHDDFKVSATLFKSICDKPVRAYALQHKPGAVRAQGAREPWGAMSLRGGPTPRRESARTQQRQALEPGMR